MPDELTPDEKADAWRKQYEAERARERQAMREAYPSGFHGDLSVSPEPTARLRFEAFTPVNAPALGEVFYGDPSEFVDHRMKDPEKWAEYTRFLTEDAPWSRKYGAVDYIAYLREDEPESGLHAGAVAGVFHVYDLSQERWLDYNYRCTVGFAVRRELRGRGYGKEGFDSVLAHARDYFGKPRALAMTHPRNEAAIALLRSYGFVDVTRKYDSGGRYAGKTVYYARRVGATRRQLHVEESGPLLWPLVQHVPADLDAETALRESLAALRVHADAVRAKAEERESSMRFPEEGQLDDALATLLAREYTWGAAIRQNAAADASRWLCDKELAPLPLDRYREDHNDMIHEFSRAREVAIDALRAVREEPIDRCAHRVALREGGHVPSPRALAFGLAGGVWEALADMKREVEPDDNVSAQGDGQ